MLEIRLFQCIIEPPDFAVKKKKKKSAVINNISLPLSWFAKLRFSLAPLQHWYLGGHIVLHTSLGNQMLMKFCSSGSFQNAQISLHFLPHEVDLSELIRCFTASFSLLERSRPCSLALNNYLANLPSASALRLNKRAQHCSTRKTTACVGA